MNAQKIMEMAREAQSGEDLVRRIQAEPGLVKVDRHASLYHHVFSPQVPDGEFPEGHNYGAIYTFADCVRTSPGTAKLRAWEHINEETDGRAHLFHYHGMFMKMDNHGRWHFKGLDPEVERPWKAHKLGKEYGI